MNLNSTNSASPGSEHEASSGRRSVQDLEKVLSERQVVDMDSEDMDPLEWTVRKALPIPKDYYWNVVSEEEAADVSMNIKLWHQTVHGLAKLYSTQEKYIGKPLVNFLGLTSSRFDYVTDHMTKEEWEQSKKVAAERKERRKMRELLDVDVSSSRDGDEELALHEVKLEDAK